MYYTTKLKNVPPQPPIVSSRSAAVTSPPSAPITQKSVPKKEPVILVIDSKPTDNANRRRKSSVGMTSPNPLNIDTTDDALLPTPPPLTNRKPKERTPSANRASSQANSYQRY